MAVVIHQPGEGEALSVGPSSIVIKATKEDTGGAFNISESTVQAGFPGPPPHIHDRMHDVFFVLEGTLTLLAGEAEVGLSAGGFASVQPGTVHTFSNRSDGQVRFLSLQTPGGFEGYFRELAAAMSEGDFDPARAGEIVARYDTRFPE